MKKILGLDLGTNSIGWALIEQDFSNKEGKIIGMGSRIIPMSQDILGKFGAGNSISQTAERTSYRGVRRLRERHLLRRERLHRVLNILGFLPQHYANEIDFTKRFGKFINHAEPKLPYHNGDFLFKKSFLEMLEDFKQNQPEFLKDKNGNDCLIPYDWTIYYLRKKALTQKIEKEEFAWLILNFNQKRGYFQLRGEDDEKTEINEFVENLTIISITKGEIDKKNNNKTWFTITFQNGWEYSATFTSEPNWLNTEREFLVIEELDKNGVIKIVKDRKSDTTGKEKRKLTPLPTFDEIALMSKKDQDKFFKKIKARTELTITNSKKTVGTYIYESLLLNPKQKIKGKLVRTIERKFYKEELTQILKKQQEFHPELQDEQLFYDCTRELYKHNEQHQQMLQAKDFTYLFLSDIIFYQRPLRSQKSSISNCTLEKRISKDGVIYPIKVISKSNPYYQEFRLLQWLQNLEIYRTEDDVKVTTDFINSLNDKEALFNFLNTKKEVEQKHIIEFLLKSKNGGKKLVKGEIDKYRWNYVSDKKYPMNETRYLIQSKLDKVEDIENNFLSFENEMALWHIIYSVNDKIEYEKAIAKFAVKHNLDKVSFVESFKKFPPFKSDYGSFSEKAIKKLLPLMRFGKSWNEDTIVKEASVYFNNIDRLLDSLNERDIAISDEDRANWNKSINSKLRNELLTFKDAEIDSFKNLRLHIAQYLVYGRHSEAENTGKWNSPEDIKWLLDPKNPKGFKQHSLRNPIVEQIITETLRVVKDIWQYYGNGAQNFFSEIHIELGREMKNTAEERKRITSNVTDNENTNLRIKALLAELKEDISFEDVRPHSPMQQDILKIYEEGVLNSAVEIEEDILKISKSAQPTKSELIRYKLWLEQKYQSPYTGQIIPLNKLFTTDYEIEHIIPQSRYFDDSLSNKVICESAVNKLKDNLLGFEFIKKHHGQMVQLDNGKTVTVFEVEAYEAFITKNYFKNRGKRNKLLLEDIPEKMIERQLNDTRYISKYISQLLSNIVRDNSPGSKDDGINSINLLPGNGKITTRLKQDWGLNDVWNELILPRFERMNELTNSTDFTSKNTNGKTIPTVPLELSKGFSKKRIDHRHHAMDALVIACATRDHINLLNNESALPKKEQNNHRFKIQGKLRNQEAYVDSKTGETRNKFTTFKKPWKHFTADTKNTLENIVVSFKQNLRVINKATNYYESFKDENGDLRFDTDGKPKKDVIKQKGRNWAIRKAMHEETVSGLVNLPWVELKKGTFITATRKNIDSNFSTERIIKITDTGIQKILFSRLSKFDECNEIISKSKLSDYIEKRKELLKNNLLKEFPEIAFSPEGIEDMNRNISMYNKGKNHQPILKVRFYEVGSGRFSIGQTKQKKSKFVQGSPNLFYAIYENDEKRNFNVIPFNEVIEHQKQLSYIRDFKEKIIPIDKSKGKFLFSLSPLDLVYIPNEGELNIDFNNLNKNQLKRLYNVNDFSATCYFTPNSFAKNIAPKEVDLKYDKKKNKLTGSYDSKTASIDGKQIKDICIKLQVDRIGNISKA